MKVENESNRFVMFVFFMTIARLALTKTHAVRLVYIAALNAVRAMRDKQKEENQPSHICPVCTGILSFGKNWSCGESYAECGNCGVILTHKNEVDIKGHLAEFNI